MLAVRVEPGFAVTWDVEVEKGDQEKTLGLNDSVETFEHLDHFRPHCDSIQQWAGKMTSATEKMATLNIYIL